MKLLVDENFRGAIVRGLLRRRPDLDLVRVFDAGLGEADDPTILAVRHVASRERRISPSLIPDGEVDQLCEMFGRFVVTRAGRRHGDNPLVRPVDQAPLQSA